MAKYQIIGPTHTKVKVNTTFKNVGDVVDSSQARNDAEIQALLAAGKIKQVSDNTAVT